METETNLNAPGHRFGPESSARPSLDQFDELISGCKRRRLAEPSVLPQMQPSVFARGSSFVETPELERDQLTLQAFSGRQPE